ncbi:MAG TPA: glycosyltransferase family 1 protein [Anaerolineae bacterium]|jgi:glycosyltransferase involved in cell wall biosynthesis
MARITIDYTPAVWQSAGIGRLTREVVRALLALTPAHDMRLLCMAGQPADLPVFNGRPAPLIRIPLTDRWLYRIWFRARLPVPIELFAGRCDLYHATDFVLPPLLPGTRTVLTVHDLTFMRDASSAQPQLLKFLTRVVRQSALCATHIVADSHATAHDLMDVYGLPAERITTIHSGVDERFSPLLQHSDEAARIRLKYGLGDASFILAVGTLQRRKNHLTLVRAFAELARGSTVPKNLQLVIAGGKGWLYDDVVAEVSALGLQERVCFTGFVDDADLPALYRAAAVFAFPSLYEGFGLPPLEALACGVPVVTSNASSLPEVVGDAGLMVDPLDVQGLAAALGRALTDLDWRAEAIARGTQRAAQFTWQRAAQQLLDVYEQVLNR